MVDYEKGVGLIPPTDSPGQRKEEVVGYLVQGLFHQLELGSFSHCHFLHALRKNSGVHAL